MSEYLTTVYSRVVCRYRILSRDSSKLIVKQILENEDEISEAIDIVKFPLYDPQGPTVMFITDSILSHDEAIKRYEEVMKERYYKSETLE